MWWFNKNKKTPVQEEAESIPAENVTIPKDKFVLENIAVGENSELPIYAIYARFLEDMESKGYHDGTSFPDTSYRDNQKRVIVDRLRLAIKEALLRYEDKLVDIERHISQAQKNGLLETCDNYIQNKKKLVAHKEELAALDKDAEEIGEKTKSLLTSYEMGFTRGLVSLSNEKVGEIMNK